MIKWVLQRTWSVKYTIFVAPFAALYCLTAYYFTPLDKFLCFVLIMVVMACLGMLFDTVDAIQRGWHDSIDTL